jgi:hypothetical protein
MTPPYPDIVAHADWGKSPSKCSIAVARRDSDGHFIAEPPSAVEDASSLLPDLRQDCSGPVLVGFDFPIGVPIAYASRAGVKRFPAWLRALSDDDLFYQPAEQAREISPSRPFYPQRPGGTAQAHLIDALGVASMSDLLRRCEHGHAGRGHASPLFWTMGAEQVGKGAITGWREVLAPALRDANLDVGLWPFDGSLGTLLESREIICAETYPGEFYEHLEVIFPPGKQGEKHGERVQEDRAANAGALLRWAENAGVEVHSDLVRALRDGFGPSGDREDPFDAVVGLFGMLNVVLGYRPSGEPDLESVRDVEGWILGQTAVAEIQSAAPSTASGRAERQTMRGRLATAPSVLLRPTGSFTARGLCLAFGTVSQYPPATPSSFPGAIFRLGSTRLVTNSARCLPESRSHARESSRITLRTASTSE